MHPKWVFKHFWSRSRSGFFPTAMLWMLSLLIGFLLCSQSPLDPVSAFQSVLSASSGPLGSLCVCVLPIVVMAIALLSPLFALSYLVVFLLGISHGYCGCMIYLAIGNASWLLRSLLLFSASCSSVLMWWLILQNETTHRLNKNIRFAGTLSCIFFVIDLLVISPIVGDLAKYF